MGTRHQGSNTEANALDAHIKLMRTSESEAGHIGQNLRPADGRRLSQFGALGALRPGVYMPECQSELGTKILREAAI